MVECCFETVATGNGTVSDRGETERTVAKARGGGVDSLLIFQGRTVVIVRTIGGGVYGLCLEVVAFRSSDDSSISDIRLNNEEEVIIEGLSIKKEEEYF